MLVSCCTGKIGRNGPSFTQFFNLNDGIMLRTFKYEIKHTITKSTFPYESNSFNMNPIPSTSLLCQSRKNASLYCSEQHILCLIKALAEF